MRWAGHVACLGEKRNVYEVLIVKPEGKRPLRRPGHRWKDDIKIDLLEIERRAWTGFIWLRTGTSGGLL
jgi:hypothetical protein